MVAAPDSYKNRQRLRAMALYRSAAAPVHAMVMAQNPPTDRPLRHWIALFRYAQRLHAWGLLTVEDLKRAEAIYPEWWYQWKTAIAAKRMLAVWDGRRGYDFSVSGYRRMPSMAAYM